MNPTTILMFVVGALFAYFQQLPRQSVTSYTIPDYNDTISDGRDILVDCPGRRFLSTHGSSSVIEYSFSSKENESEDLSFSSCYSPPRRTHNIKRACFTTFYYECTPKLAMEHCYPPTSCAPGFVLATVSLNRIADTQGGYVESNAVCCRT